MTLSILSIFIILNIICQKVIIYVIDMKPCTNVYTLIVDKIDSLCYKGNMQLWNEKIIIQLLIHGVSMATREK